ncbi:MAG: hypothetical protein V4618_05650 [Pseudomonadota bacterium]
MRAAYLASVATMEDAARRAREEHNRYEASGEDDAEYDETGALTYSTRHSLDYDAMDAGLAINVVREAFITSAFHYWERSARSWTGLYAPSDRFPELSAASRKKYPLSSQLDVLNRLNNFLKHSGDKKARSLAKLRPDYFRPLFPGQHPRLWITHEHVQAAFETVSASGPTYDA